ncbi:hypothetical protein FTRO_0050030 [Fructobacillus tropaeoli]|uniref:Uncharacterized protein n=1 Tax=Fructobacillus tropaeoli TaxID=709323 RepID=A0A3F3GZR5_9LACO|nr:hypothetical protein FTRO_0050030 [Fructobacillus tropaeoli]
MNILVTNLEDLKSQKMLHCFKMKQKLKNVAFKRGGEYLWKINAMI